MNEAEIRAAVKTIVGAIPREKGDPPKQLIGAAVGLAEQLLVDVHRIADALEVIAGTRTASGKPVTR